MDLENKDRRYDYEAVIFGKSLSAYFMAYILKLNRIRFALVSKEAEKAGFPYEITDEDFENARRLYKKLAGKVGYLLDDEDEELLKGEKRLIKLLDSELSEDVKENLPEDNTGLSENTIILSADDDVVSAGARAFAIVEQKQMSLEKYMKKLRIKSGKRTERELVYVTQSKAWFYAREAVMKFAIDRGVAPINPYMNYGFYLNGAVERDEITECSHQMVRAASALWVFGPVSEAILTDIVVAVMEGKEIRFFSISDNTSEIREIPMEEIVFEREVHAGKIKKNDLLDFVKSTLPRIDGYVQMSLFDQIN